MATVDLDKLAIELTAADVRFADYDRGNGRQLALVGITVWEDRWETTGMTNRLVPDPMFWTALDIIRRHIAPVAPDPGLREAIRDAIFNSLTITYDPKTDCDLVSCDTELSADAVLSVLAERGVR